ncbi:MAG: hypothetical protein R3Y38_00440 [Rikenellaceae bacterium]
MIRILVIIFCAFFLSCRTDEVVISSTSTFTGYVYYNIGDVKGFFVLNEGNMGSNKATLDYFDYSTSTYTRNIFAERNPNVVLELGDVGNDLKVYSDRLYAVINNSNLVEVMELSTAYELGAVSVGSPRYIAFEGDYGYISSYQDVVYKLDLNSLKIVDTCAVGLNPEQIEVVGGKLYVANSYADGVYDNTVSVIDLMTFTETKRIEVGENVYSLKVDDNNKLWVSTWGNYSNIASRTHLINTTSDTLEESFDVKNTRMSYCNNMLYIINEDGNLTINTNSKTVEDSPFIIDNSFESMTTPYALAVNPETEEIFITDAGNYVTPGTIYCYSPQGVLRWSATTGDIPSAIAFTTVSLEDVGPNTSGGGDDDEPEEDVVYVSKVLEYVPAPGQFVGVYPTYVSGDSAQDMCDKALTSIQNSGLVTLGGWGGYVIVGFDSPIENKAGLRDFRVLGNASYTGGAEPGVIMVSRDENGNGLADDTWYEVVGSEHQNSTTKQVTYTSDSSNFPAWITSDLSFEGTELPNNSSMSGTTIVLSSFEWGYADNVSNTSTESAIDISWANPELESIDFIKIYTGVDAINGVLGECSTEFAGIDDLHKMGIEIETR